MLLGVWVDLSQVRQQGFTDINNILLGLRLYWFVKDCKQTMKAQLKHVQSTCAQIFRALCALERCLIWVNTRGVTKWSSAGLCYTCTADMYEVFAYQHFPPQNLYLISVFLEIPACKL